MDLPHRTLPHVSITREYNRERESCQARSDVLHCACMQHIERVKTIENIRRQRLSEAKRLVEKTRAIRKKITAKSGTWDAAEVVRTLRYAA